MRPARVQGYAKAVLPLSMSGGTRGVDAGHRIASRDLAAVM